jgi:1-acyl-sn-glycerol-3-phosphate acyltransferase
MAREVYHHSALQWMFRSFHYIPVQRGMGDISALRTALRALAQGEVVGMFPEGGIDKFREEEGHPGIGFLALKSGAPVVPVSIRWDSPRPMTLLGALLTAGKADIRYGTPFVVQRDRRPSRNNIRHVTSGIMQALRDLQAVQEKAS